MQTASIGRIVYYRLSKDDADAVNRRHEDAKRNMDLHRVVKNGTQVHVGAEAKEGDVLPMLFVKVAGMSATGQVFLDGNDTLWVRDALHGNEPGQWLWPERT